MVVSLGNKYRDLCHDPLTHAPLTHAPLTHAPLTHGALIRFTDQTLPIRSEISSIELLTLDIK